MTWIKTEGSASNYDVAYRALLRWSAERSLPEVAKIINEPGITWKVRRALLRSKGVPQELIEILVEKDEGP